MSDYRIDLKVRNNNFIYQIEKAGYKSVGEFCRLNGLMNQVSIIGAIINMTQSPLDSKGNFRPAVMKCAKILNCSPELFFNETQLSTIIQSNKRSIQVNEAEMRFALENQNNMKLLEDNIFDEQRSDAIEAALDCLRPIEKQVIEMRYGLGKYAASLTLEEVGQKLRVSRERVRQIECKALRKLRSPAWGRTRKPLGKLQEIAK